MVVLERYGNFHEGALGGKRSSLISGASAPPPKACVENRPTTNERTLTASEIDHLRQAPPDW